MSVPIILAALWVLAATATAFLPLHHQRGPGLALLITAPLLIGWLAFAHGPVVGLAALAGFVSMFRNPLRYFWRRWRGLPTVPPE